MEGREIKRFVSDLNSINNQLHAFATRVAFMEVAEEYISKHKKIKYDMTIIMSVYISMANDAVLRITSIYDRKPNALSIYYLLDWIKKNRPLLKLHMHSLNLNFSQKDVDFITESIDGFKLVVSKFRHMRNNLVAHNNREMVDAVDIRRNLMIKGALHDKELFVSASKEYFKKVSKFLLKIKDFILIKDHTIKVVLELKNLLKMPDRIFAKSGNVEEWANFTKSQKEEALRLFKKLSREYTVSQ